MLLRLLFILLFGSCSFDAFAQFDTVFIYGNWKLISFEKNVYSRMDTSDIEPDHKGLNIERITKDSVYMRESGKKNRLLAFRFKRFETMLGFRLRKDKVIIFVDRWDSDTLILSHHGYHPRHPRQTIINYYIRNDSSMTQVRALYQKLLQAHAANCNPDTSFLFKDQITLEIGSHFLYCDTLAKVDFAFLQDGQLRAWFMGGRKEAPSFREAYEFGSYSYIIHPDLSITIKWKWGSYRYRVISDGSKLILKKIQP